MAKLEKTACTDDTAERESSTREERARVRKARATFARLAPLVLFTACAGSTPPHATAAPPANRHEFATETSDAVFEATAPSFTGPDGRLIPEVIRGYVHAHWGGVWSCYERGRKKDPRLAGKITVKYVIGEDGLPRDVVDEGSTLPDREVIGCVLGLFRNFRYDPNRSGNLTIVYPIQLTPPTSGRRTDPFFDEHGGSYGYQFAADTAALVAAAPAPAESLPPGPGGRLFSESIQTVVRKSFGAISSCYGAGRKKNPKLAGDVNIKYVIREDGAVAAVADGNSTVSDKEVTSCVLDVFRKLRYPESHGGSINVLYAIQFEP